MLTGTYTPFWRKKDDSPWHKTSDGYWQYKDEEVVRSTERPTPAPATPAPQTPATPATTFVPAKTTQEQIAYILGDRSAERAAIDQNYGLQRDILRNQQGEQAASIARQKRLIEQQYSTEPDPMIRAMLARQVKDLDARLAAALPSISMSYAPAVDGARAAALGATTQGNTYGAQLAALYNDAAAQNSVQSLGASDSIAAALGGQVAGGNTSATARDFGQYMQGMAPIQQKAAQDYGAMLSALLTTDANSSTRQLGADQALAQNMTQQMVFQANQEAAQREYEQVQAAKAARAQALMQIERDQAQAALQFQQQQAALMQGRFDAYGALQKDETTLGQATRMQELERMQSAAGARLPAALDDSVPRTGDALTLGPDEDGKIASVTRERVRSAVEIAYMAAIDPSVSPSARWSTYQNVLVDSGIPEWALINGKALEFGNTVFAGN